MLDRFDSSSSLLRSLVYSGLKDWNSEALIQALHDKSMIVRTAAARRLHLQPDTDLVLDRVVLLASSANASLRELAAFVLGQLGTPAMPRRIESYPHLVGLLSDKDEYVRAASASGIGSLSYEDMPSVAEDRLIALKSDVSGSVRAAVAYALGNSSGKETALGALKLLLRDKDCDVRSWAELGMELLSERSARKDGTERRR